jgi:hypothetical protein
VDSTEGEISVGTATDGTELINIKAKEVVELF